VAASNERHVPWTRTWLLERIRNLPFADFVPKFRGNELEVAPPNPAHIGGMGLMIADGKDGPFAIAVDSVQAYRDSEPFSLGDYQWENRLLVVSSPAPAGRQQPGAGRAETCQAAATGRSNGHRV
jgi:hypothetical protein